MDTIKEAGDSLVRSPQLYGFTKQRVAPKPVAARHTEHPLNTMVKAMACDVDEGVLRIREAHCEEGFLVAVQDSALLGRGQSGGEFGEVRRRWHSGRGRGCCGCRTAPVARRQRGNTAPH